MTTEDFRKSVRSQLERLSPIVDAALQRELSKPIDLGNGGRLQFEIDGTFYGITLIQTEEKILPDDVVWNGIPEGVQESAQDTGIDLFKTIEEELLPWLAERWQQVGGPDQYRPAYAFFHGGLHEPRYDLEQKRWFTVEEVFG